MARREEQMNSNNDMEWLEPAVLLDSENLDKKALEAVWDADKEGLLEEENQAA